MLNWLLTLEEAVMLQTVSRFLPELPLFFMTAVATHLVMSFAQTLMHYKLLECPARSRGFGSTRLVIIDRQAPKSHGPHCSRTSPVVRQMARPRNH
jgi:hypothetical protein